MREYPRHRATKRQTRPATPELNQSLKAMNTDLPDFQKGMIYTLAKLLRQSEVQFIEDAIRNHMGPVVKRMIAQKKAGKAS